MTYRIEIERRAHKALSRLLKRVRVRVVAVIDALAQDARPAGEYRVIYLVLDDEEPTRTPIASLAYQAEAPRI